MHSVHYLKNVLKAAAAIVFVLPLFSTAEVSAKPAQFGNALPTLNSQVQLPEAFEGGHTTLAVYCQTDVTANGDLENIQCYQKPKIANLQQQTISALESATFEPAEIDGKPVPVRMQFRVVYSRSGDQPDIVLLPNLGTLQNEYGVDYFAPQERLDGEPWFQQYAKNGWAKGQTFFAEGRLTRVMGVVSPSGEVGKVSTLDARGSGKRDASAVEDALKQSRFIPGFVENQPTEMHYVAVLNYAR